MAALGADMKLDLLAIAAHPDDAELTCGGTLAKMAAAGYQVGILDLTQGEMGTRGTPEIRAREAAAAAKTLGLQYRENLGLPDAQLEPTQEYKLKLAARIRALRPHTPSSYPTGKPATPTTTTLPNSPTRPASWRA